MIWCKTVTHGGQGNSQKSPTVSILRTTLCLLINSKYNKHSEMISPHFYLPYVICVYFQHNKDSTYYSITTELSDFYWNEESDLLNVINHEMRLKQCNDNYLFYLKIKRESP